MSFLEKDHIVMVYQTDLSPDAQGGGIRYVQELVDYLLNAGWNITFLGAGSFQGKKNPRLNFYRMCSKDAPWVFFFFGIIRFLLGSTSLPSGVIHVHRDYFALPFLLLKPKAPVVCTLHGYTLQALGLRSNFLRFLVTPIFRPIEKQALKGIKRLLSVDERTASAFVNRYPFIKEKMMVIPTTINFKKFLPGDVMTARKQLGFSPSDEIVLCVGRLHPQKNIPFLLRVFSKIEESRPHARLLIAGDGPDKYSLVEYAKNLKLKRVSFLGAVSHNEIPLLMQAADVFALSSRFEGSPIAVKEALAIGLPVVITDVGDVRLVIKNKDQGTVTPHEESAFFEALLERLGDHPTSREAINKRTALKNELDFSPENIQERIIRIYKDLRGA